MAAEIASVEVRDDLLSVLSLKRKEGENAVDFTVRAVSKATKCPEKTWDKLQEDTQEWVNNWLLAEEARGEEDTELPILEAEEDTMNTAITVDADVPEFLDRRRKDNGQTIVASAPSDPDDVEADDEDAIDSEDEPEEDVGVAAIKENVVEARQGRPKLKWSMKTAYALCRGLVTKLQEAGVQARERKGSTFLTREQAYKALEKLQQSFEQAGADPGPELSEAMEAMSEPGAGGRPATKKSVAAPPKKTPPQKNTKVVVEEAIDRIEQATGPVESVTTFGSNVPLDPLLISIWDRYPAHDASEREFEIWFSLLRGSLELLRVR